MGNFYYGGQAVIEGVMMRGRQRAAIAVRDPKGGIVIHEEALPARIYRSRASQIPFVRGMVLLWDALVLGTRSLMWSADVAIGEEEGSQGFSGPMAWGTLAVSLAVGIGLFIALPAVLGGVAERLLDVSKVSASFIEGVMRLLMFVGYIVLIGRLPDVKRVFAYHGAEHKTINAYEAGAQLTPANVARYSTLHTRCGTSFLLFVLVISIILFTPLQFDNWFLRIGSRLLLIPLVAGIAYEFLRFSTQHQKNRIMRLIIAPGLAMQRLTTREPDETMLEVAIAALIPVLVADGLEVPSAPTPVMATAAVGASASGS